MWICQTCGVEHAAAVEVCAICADERQWVPAAGQQWTTLDELAAAGHRARVRELEQDLFGVTVEPKVSIGQQAHLVRTPAGNLLWDVPGYLDDNAVQRVHQLGGVSAIVASHPHHFGVQVEWSRALGGVPVLVSEPNMEWVSRPDHRIRPWAGRLEVLPGITLVQLGGHFPGSAVAHWAAGGGGKGVLFSADTIQTNRDRTSVTFMRSYPNRIPLSAAVVVIHTLPSLPDPGSGELLSGRRLSDPGPVRGVVVGHNGSSLRRYLQARRPSLPRRALV